MYRTRRDENAPPNLEQRGQVRELYEKYKTVRAEVIDGATYVEAMLESVLCDAFAGKTEAHRNRLRATILAGEAMGFLQKWKSLRTLLAEEPTWLGTRPPDTSAQISALHKAIGDRNKFAHGELLVHEQSLQVVVRFFEGKHQELELTDSVVQEILLRLQAVYFWLETLHMKFYTTP